MRRKTSEIWLQVYGDYRKMVFKDGNTRMLMRANETPHGKPCTVTISIERLKPGTEATWIPWIAFKIIPNTSGATVTTLNEQRGTSNATKSAKA